MNKMLDPFWNAGKEITKPSFELSTSPLTTLGSNTWWNTHFDKTDFSRESAVIEPEDPNN